MLLFKYILITKLVRHMPEIPFNRNMVTSESLLVDENPVMLEKRLDDARSLLSFADSALPIEKTGSIQLSSRDSMAIKTRETVNGIRAFFGDDSDFLLNEGLRSMDAKLSKPEYCDDNKVIQGIEFILRMNDLSKETNRPDLYNRLVTTVSWLRATKLAQENLATKVGRLFMKADGICTVVNENPQYLDQAYTDLQKNNGSKFLDFMEFVKDSGQELEESLRVAATSEHDSNTTEDTTQTSLRKDTVIGDDITKLDQCLSDANQIELAIITPRYDEVIDASNLPDKEATEYALSMAYKELELFGGFASKDQKSNYSIDHGLRALGDKLGDPKYHGPRYDIQNITFALRFDQLISESKQQTDIKNRIKSVATYLRSAKLAEIELYKTHGFLAVSSPDVAEKANDPKLLQRAWNELSAYDDALFGEFFDNMKRISEVMANGLRAIHEHPEWYQDLFK